MVVKKGYKNTEVGVIPNDWEVHSLKDEIDQLEAGVSVNSINDDSSISAYDQVILKTSSVYSGVFYPNEAKRILPKDIPRARLNPRQDSIIISRMNTPELVGECGYVSNTLPNHFIPDRLWMTKFKKGSNTNVKWLSYVISHPKYKRAIKEIATGTSGSMKNISKSGLLAVKVPYPSIFEQTAIATALSDTDVLISRLEKLIAKKRAIKQGAMQELLKPRNGWIEKRLGDVASLKARIGWQGLTTAEYRTSGDYFLITGTEFKGGFINWDKCFYVDKERYIQDSNIQVRQHDVLVTKDGTIGKVALIKELPKPATLNSGVFVIRPIKESFDAEFFYYLLLSYVFSKFLGQLSAGSTINHLYQKDFVSFKFSTPKTINEQKKIAKILLDMDEELSSLEAKLSKYRQIKSGMMENLLTGKIRLV
jgi:type I restriction enzyme, S subunit